MADYVGQQFGNYRLLKLLGEGGFAEVYLGEHVHLGTPAAVKVLTTKLTGEGIALFREEAHTILSLEHPNIVRVYDFGIQDRIPYIIMNYAPNGSLRRLHPRGTHLPIEKIVSYVKQIAAALQYAHNRKLIHRDIKPDNMLLGLNNEVLLSDFGIAVVAHSTRSLNTQDGSGTLSYMAPEQIQGKPRIASDQYALGIVVYEWLNGRPPFMGTAAEIGMQHLLTPPPSLRENVPAISYAVEQVVFKALDKDPKQRFESVQEFASALEQTNQRKKPAPPTYPSVTMPMNQSQQLTMAAPSPKPLLEHVELGESNPPSKLRQLTNDTSQMFDSIQRSKSIYSILLLGLSLFLFGALTPWHAIPMFEPLGGFFLTFFGWGAYFLALGLLALSVAHLVEGVRKTRIIRWSLVYGLIVLFLLLLAESRLILGNFTGGVIGAFLVRPLLGWPVPIQHELVLGLCIIVAIETFYLTYRR